MPGLEDFPDRVAFDIVDVPIAVVAEQEGDLARRHVIHAAQLDRHRGRRLERGRQENGHRWLLLLLC